MASEAIVCPVCGDPLVLAYSQSTTTSYAIGPEGKLQEIEYDCHDSSGELVCATNGHRPLRPFTYDTIEGTFAWLDEEEPDGE